MHVIVTANIKRELLPPSPTLPQVSNCPEWPFLGLTAEIKLYDQPHAALQGAKCLRGSRLLWMEPRLAMLAMVTLLWHG